MQKQLAPRPRAIACLLTFCTLLVYAGHAAHCGSQQPHQEVDWPILLHTGDSPAREGLRPWAGGAACHHARTGHRPRLCCTQPGYATLAGAMIMSLQKAPGTPLAYT